MVQSDSLVVSGTQFSQIPGCRVEHGSVRFQGVEWDTVQSDSCV